MVLPEKETFTDRILPCPGVLELPQLQLRIVCRQSGLLCAVEGNMECCAINAPAATTTKPLASSKSCIPTIASLVLKQITGSHSPVVLVSVYGNREYDDAFVEMQDLLEANGFVVVAAGAFIAQHSIFPSTAHKRPDVNDYEKIKTFGLKCREILKKGCVDNSSSIFLPGNRPYKIPGKIPLKITVENTCTKCHACVKVCPTGAISYDNPQITDYKKCIHCGRCMTICNSHARHYKGLLYKIAEFIFRLQNHKRKEPEFFLTIWNIFKCIISCLYCFLNLSY